MDYPVTHHSGKIRRGTWYIATQSFPTLHGVRGIVPGWTSYVRIRPQLEMGNAPMLLHDSCRDWSNHHVTVAPSNNTRIPYGCKLCDWMGRGDSVFLNECDTVANNFRLCSQKIARVRLLAYATLCSISSLLLVRQSQVSLYVSYL